MQAARAENATQLVLGASRRSRWDELTRGSVIGGIIREAGRALDVHVISTTDAGADSSERTPLPPIRMRLTPLPRRRQLAGFLVAVVGLPLLTLVLTPFRDDIGFTSAAFCYLMLVVAAATVGGIWPAAFAAVAGFGLLNWFFAEPIHTFTIRNERDLAAVAAFLVVAAVVSTPGRRRRPTHRRGQASAERGRGARRDGRLAACARATRSRSCSPTSWPCSASTTPRWCAPNRTPRCWPRPAPRPGDDAESLTLPLTEGVELRVAGTDLLGADRDVLGAFAAQLAVALETRRLQDEAAAAEALMQGNELRTALLAAVSHDLRTPLASIKTSSSSLLSADVSFTDEQARALLETIDEEADRLNNLVGNLLDMSRIQAGALVVKRRAGRARRGDRRRPQRPARPRAPHPPRRARDAAAGRRRPGAARAGHRQHRRQRAALRAARHPGPGRGGRVRRPRRPPRRRHRSRHPRRTSATRCSGRSSASATAPGAPASASGWRWLVASCVAMDGELTVEDTPGGGTTMVLSLPEAGG